jgi:hypothetical protein
MLCYTPSPRPEVRVIDSAAMPLARRIDGRIGEAVERGLTPQIILDLDGTLFDNVPRTKRILGDEAARLFGDDASITRVIGGMAESDFEYNPVDTLRKHGVTDEATLERLREAWAGRFFGSEYLLLDAPLSGAVDAARSWWRRGAELNYLTGRHVPEMFVGTCRSLDEAGFPVGTVRTQLLMKPAFDLDDIAFKIDTIPDIRRKGPVVLLVDNDPRVLNPLSALLPDAISVMVRTLHPKDAPAPAERIALVNDFRELLA